MSTIKADNYANRLGTKSVPADYVVNGTAKAWAVLDMGGPTVLGSLNVSSVTGFGPGDFQKNFTSAMANANYAQQGSSNSFHTATVGASRATTSCRIQCIASDHTTQQAVLNATSDVTGPLA